jgi:hypothetical protein
MLYWIYNLCIAGGENRKYIKWTYYERLFMHLILTACFLEQGTITKVQDRTTLCLWTFSRCKLTTRFPRARLQHLR